MNVNGNLVRYSNKKIHSEQKTYDMDLTCQQEARLYKENEKIYSIFYGQYSEHLQHKIKTSAR